MLIITKRGKVERRKGNKSKDKHKKKLPFIACRNDGRKEEEHRCHSQHKPLSLTYMNLSLNYTYKEVKITWKRKQKLTLQRMKNWTNSYLCLVVLLFTFEIAGIYRRNEDRKNWLFLNLNPPLIPKLDFMWIFSSDLQFVGVLIAEYHLSNDRIKNSDQHKSCSPVSLLSGSSSIIRFEIQL